MSSSEAEERNGEAGPSSSSPIKAGRSPTGVAQTIALPGSPQPLGSTNGQEGTLAAAAQILSPKAGSVLSDAGGTPRSSMDVDHADRTERAAQLEQELHNVRQERDVLAGQYRGLLGKLTAMRSTLGEKLKSDAVSPVPARIVQRRFCVRRQMG